LVCMMRIRHWWKSFFLNTSSSLVSATTFIPLIWEPTLQSENLSRRIFLPFYIPYRLGSVFDLRWNPSLEIGTLASAFFFLHDYPQEKSSSSPPPPFSINRNPAPPPLEPGNSHRPLRFHRLGNESYGFFLLFFNRSFAEGVPFTHPPSFPPSKRSYFFFLPPQQSGI